MQISFNVEKNSVQNLVYHSLRCLRNLCITFIFTKQNAHNSWIYQHAGMDINFSIHLLERQVNSDSDLPE